MIPCIKPDTLRNSCEKEKPGLVVVCTFRVTVNLVLEALTKDFISS